tara:strand:- start:2647 stop:3027 length:381 start_codon:yes stop_codon:yes gene_type:complete
MPGKLNMVKNKQGKMVPDYAADGVGKMMRGGQVKMMRGGKVPGMMRGGKVKMMRGGEVPEMQGGGSIQNAMPEIRQGVEAVKQMVSKPRAQVDGMSADQMNSAMGMRDVPMTSGGMRKMRDGGRVF